MVVIQGKGTISVTEPGRDVCTYYENAEIQVFDGVIHFMAYGKYKTAALNNCLLSWSEAPSVHLTDAAS